MQKITLFTDGSSRGNPGPGGWAAIVLSEEGNESRVTELGGAERNTTNNRMELSGAIAALAHVSSHAASDAAITLHTDSSYVINGITKWVHGWKKKGWITSTKQEVLNRDLWEKLLAVSAGKKISWSYVGGHSGIAGNERCDEIATSFADGAPTVLYAGPLSGYGRDILNLQASESAVSQKKKSSSHSRAKAYSYLSLVDGKVERHATWAECEARVKGRAAKFKKSVSLDDEREILRSWEGK